MAQRYLRTCTLYYLSLVYMISIASLRMRLAARGFTQPLFSATAARRKYFLVSARGFVYPSMPPHMQVARNIQLIGSTQVPQSALPFIDSCCSFITCAPGRATISFKSLQACTTSSEIVTFARCETSASPSYGTSSYTSSWRGGGCVKSMKR